MGSETRVAADRILRPSPARRPTWEVPIGDVVIGGSRAIAVQSMTTTPTADAQATAARALRGEELADAHPPVRETRRELSGERRAVDRGRVAFRVGARDGGEDGG